jgi:hypothetical protein
MATKEIIIMPGETVPKPIEAALLDLFGSGAVNKAIQGGGKLRLTLTVPWPKPPKVKREKKVIDQAFVERLKSLAKDESELERFVETLNGPEILRVASLLEVPMSKTSKLPSLRAQLQKTLRSEIVWNSIAGQPNAVGQSMPSGHDSADEDSTEPGAGQSSEHASQPPAAGGTSENLPH